ncbi:hypothetical protein LVJ94_18380 [Pendulispora rubella]|uniref:Uncharacterized protein n=1 Tax=Pendulispora rubella TaxID=2741070 RepID=A0ABZ2LFN0_9BACT
MGNTGGDVRNDEHHDTGAHGGDAAPGETDAGDAGNADAEGADGGGVDAGDTDSGETDAGPSGPWVPANLPANICDTPSTAELNVPAGGERSLTSDGTCDALVPQDETPPNICVRKFASATIAGSLRVETNERALAIVVTGSFTIPTGGVVQAISMGDFRGRPSFEYPDVFVGLPGAGHIGAGESTGLAGGPAYGPTSGTQLVAGAFAGSGSLWHGVGGTAGGALQLVACSELALTGTVSVRGGDGSPGNSHYVPHAEYPGGGGGGGSGGTLVLDAKRIVGNGGALLAVGGQGGAAGFDPEAPGIMTSPGGAGAPGRTVIHVPQGTSLPAITSTPPAEVLH